MTVRNLVLFWLAWVLMVIGFQALTGARFQPQWPDQLIWFKGDPTDPAEVINYRQVGHPYMMEPFMNNQVSWDSENYIGISIGGYDDPCITVAYPSVRALGGLIVPCTDSRNRGNEQPIRISYAFFPFYPLLIRLFSIPLGLLQLNPIATATLAGVIVSALGTLGAMLALYDLTCESLGEEGSMRAVFYLLIFPTSFFFVQVYTEGLFVGLAFGCLAMLRRKHLVLAALLAGAATLTRAVGIMLLIPMAISWIRTHEWYELDMEWDQLYFKRPPWRPIWHALLAFTPLVVYLVWKFSYYGAMFDYAETAYFGRAPLNIGNGFAAWAHTIYGVFVGHEVGRTDIVAPLAWRVHYSIELFCSVLGFITILRCLKTDPEVAWFSLAAFLIAWVSGPPGIHRYMLVAPAVFITLARWGKNQVFDRVWTVASLLLMGFLAMLYAFNFWVA
jgi:Gpi18-like mannosyltransferase